MKSKILFYIGILLASWSLLWRIADFPIYFFCDEAVFAQTALEWVGEIRRHFRGFFAPIYFEIAAGRITPMFSSYIQAFGASLFGLSVVVARSTNAIAALIGVVALSFAAKKFFAPRMWWLLPVLFASIPIWFVFARTAFDLPVSVGLLGVVILFYCQYRLVSPRYIYPLVLSASAFFYTYASSQIVLPIITLFALILDFKYHWNNRRFIIPAALLAIILAMPAIILCLGPISPFSGQMRALDSYLIKPISVQEKILIFIKGYFSCFDPIFWLSADINELIRHRLLGYGYFPIVFVPFLVAGLLINLRKIRDPAHRFLVICVFAIPVPAALSQLEINRILTLIVPFTLWTLMGLEWLLDKRRFHRQISILILIALLLNCIDMTIEAVRNGSRWYSNYGLFGLQYGTRQLFESEIPQVLKEYPQDIIQVSPNFANDPSSLVKFFFPPEVRRQVTINAIDPKIRQEINANVIYVLSADEYQQVVSSGKFDKPLILREVPYPDGTIGFYFIKVRYVENVAEIFELERQRRRALTESTASINGEEVKVAHSMLDMGSVNDIFDDNSLSLARGYEANPFVLEVEFKDRKLLSKIGVNFGGIRSHSEVYLISKDSVQQKFLVDIDGREKPGLQWINWPSYKEAKKLRILIKNIDSPEIDHIHIFDIKFDFVDIDRKFIK